MPLWTIHHSPGVFTDDDKASLAGEITDRYEKVGLPRFYVVVIFREVTAADFFVGGVSAPLSARVEIAHIARHLPDSASRRRTARWVGDVLAPYLERHDGLHWEFHIDETSEELWMINGLVPPPARSDAEKEWARTNEAAAY
ncbi:tautomerase family protein [Williamsia sp.]|uniref:tautomerase family protein n=1 Tax=Williamsia sp. TaxID=1872085 RepID=UPI001A2F7FFC|nr:tautomerase family protein [Williamsia sp.]MBJ7289975.1 tautomerase family protein [Williamsia sp.]